MSTLALAQEMQDDLDTIDVPEGADPIDYLGWEIARELGILRFEVQIGERGGAIRKIGDTGPGISFTISQAVSA